MKEKIEKINFNEITLEESQDLLNELLTYDGDEFKELVTSIIDTVDFTLESEGKIPVSIDVIFNNDRVKIIVDELLSEYSDESQDSTL